MNGTSHLGDFLRTRRAQLRPEDAGVRTYGERRRVPGLRREEPALPAGVSVPYCTRLEQGQSQSASPAVLDAIARALRLDESEVRHLRHLARADRRRPRERRPAPERVTDAMRQLLDALGDVPAIVLGRRSDVLAWNRLGHALFAGHLAPRAPESAAGRPTMARLVFLDAHTRGLYADRPDKARAVVGNLRLVAGRHPDDGALHALVVELSARSAGFVSMWADPRVRACSVAAYAMRHPLVGALTVTQRTLSDGPGPGIVVATTTSGSSSRAALTLLAQAVRSAPPAVPEAVAAEALRTVPASPGPPTPTV
ncbi:helix-turn-helix transcriptional regulator [Streptomyces sp. NPDC048508]|uniref:helix-turn-helix transcriptional regulator n=1 Tax=Streptomyces sp. NPDC048508 TaxID=3365561 RepID=UPI003710040E